MADSSLVFTVEKTCPLCGEVTRVTKAKSRLVVIKTDWDFCTHYRDFNPYYYVPWVCEKCGYAADEKHFSAAMPTSHKKTIGDFLKRRHVEFKYSLERYMPDVVAAYKLAIFYEEMVHSSMAYRASLYLKLAWIYRIAEDTENERSCLIRAAESYEKSIYTERYPLGDLTDSMVMYLLGAMNYEMGDVEKATQYISRMVNDNGLRLSNPKLMDKIKDLWTELREKRAEEQAKLAKKNAAGVAKLDAALEKRVKK